MSLSRNRPCGETANKQHHPNVIAATGEAERLLCGEFASQIVAQQFAATFLEQLISLLAATIKLVIDR